MKFTQSMLAGLLALLIAGCAEEEPEVAPPPVQETVKTVSNTRVLEAFYNKSGLNGPFPDRNNATEIQAVGTRIAASVAELKRASERANDPEVVVDTAADFVADKIREAEAQNLWALVPPLVQGYQSLRPDDKTFEPMIQLAQQELTRPKVALRGLYHDHNSGMTTASLKVFNPMTRKTTTENVRMGEKIGGLKFTRVIGKDEGIELELEATGTTFQIMKGEDIK